MYILEFMICTKIIHLVMQLAMKIIHKYLKIENSIGN